MKNESLKGNLKQLIIPVYFKVSSGLLWQQVALASFLSLCFCHLKCDALGGRFLKVTFFEKMDFEPIQIYINSVVLYQLSYISQGFLQANEGTRTRTLIYCSNQTELSQTNLRVGIEPTTDRWRLLFG